MQYNAEYKTCHQTSLSILKEFGFGNRLMESRIQTEVEKFIGRAKGQNGRPFDPNLMILSSVMNVIHSILFGTRLECGGPKINQIIDVIHRFNVSLLTELFAFPQLRYIPYYGRKWNNSLALFNELSDFVGAALDDAMSGEKRESFARRYSEINSGRSKLIAVLCDLLSAGTDTTTTTLKWCLILLANHPDVQTRLQKEIDSAVPRGERLPSLDDRPRLPFVEAALLEVMRFKTLIPLALPHRTLCETKVEEYSIPDNVVVRASF